VVKDIFGQRISSKNRNRETKKRNWILGQFIPRKKRFAKNSKNPILPRITSATYAKLFKPCMVAPEKIGIFQGKKR